MTKKPGESSFEFEGIGPHGTQPEFEDGTNIPFGSVFREEFTRRVLPWYIPSEAEGSINWIQNLKKLRDRFDYFIDHYCRLECCLVQMLIPRIGQVQSQPPCILPHQQCFCSGVGLRKEPARLFGRSLVAQCPIMSVHGEPILESDGKPTPFRFGMSRDLIVLAIPDESRSLPYEKLNELLGDGRNILFQLPPEIAVQIWQNWPTGFSQRSSEFIWLDALFELAWQRESGSPFHLGRFAWAGNGSVALAGRGLFPRLPDFAIACSNEEFCPHENGYPKAFYSKITDVARASIAAIDEILEFDVNPPRNQAAAKAGNDMQAEKNQVFISYSHKDKKFLDQLVTHLKPMERAGLLTSWSDKQIKPGSEWFHEIQAALSRAKIAVLLVTSDFLASEFIHQQELTPLLKEAEEGGVRILWVPVRACTYKDTPIQKYQAAISPDKPLAQMKAECRLGASM